MIAVTFALPEESKDLRRELRDSRHIATGKAGPMLTGSVRGVSVALCHTGVGRESALRETRNFLSLVQPKLLISSGFAGALSPDLRVGSVVFDARETTHRGLDELVAECVAGKIHTAERAIESPADKAALARETGALAVDMETASVASVCAETGIPVVGIRGISDAASDPLPVPMPHWFDLERQRPRPLGLVCYLAKHPGSIGPFARFVGGLSCARSAMTSAVIIFMEEIGRSKK